MKYSFDDYAIGTQSESGRSLGTREIQHPSNLTKAELYTFASEACTALNGLLPEEAAPLIEQPPSQCEPIETVTLEELA